MAWRAHAGAWHGVITDERELLHDRGWEKVFARSGVHLAQLRIRVNNSLPKGGSRLQGWEPHIERLPDNANPLSVTVCGERMFSSWW